MTQGWVIDPSADTLTFHEAVTNGAAIVVKQYASGAVNATDLWAYGAWSEAFGYPTEVEYFADRLIYAGTASQPQTLWLSRTGDYKHFGRSTPIVDDDAIAATLNARQVNAVRDLIPLDRLIMLTTGGEWKTTGGADEVLTPSTIGFKPQSYHGASTLHALVIGSTAIFPEASGRVIRDIGYSFETDGYTGNDLTIFSPHLFEGRTMVAWAYQKIPFSAVWIVFSDGGVACMTYMREQEVVAITPMEFPGATAKSVCCVREGDEDAVYFIFERTIDGSTKKFIERLQSREFDDINDAWFVDCGLSYDGTDTTNTMTLTGSGWTTESTLTLTASAAKFASTDVGDWVVFGYGTDDELRLQITAYTSTTVVSVVPLKDVAVAYRAVAQSTWAWGRDTMAGLDHLEGEEVMALVDGSVQGPFTVTDGEVTLDPPGTRVTVGLAYDCDFETLDISSAGETIRNKRKLVKKVGLLVKDSRNIQAGTDFDNLFTHEPRSDEAMGEVSSLQSGLIEITPASSIDTNGRVCVRQDKPLPLTILSVLPSVILIDD